MTAQDVQIAIADLDGTPRLAVDEAHGYVIESWDDNGQQWVTQTATAPWVDDEFEVNARKGPTTLQALIRCQGADMPHADGLKDALAEAVSTPHLLTRTSAGVSYTWRCRRGNWSSSFTTEDWLLHRRNVALSIPASPNTTSTGTVAP